MQDNLLQNIHERHTQQLHDLHADMEAEVNEMQLEDDILGPTYIPNLPRLPADTYYRTYSAPVHGYLMYTLFLMAGPGYNSPFATALKQEPNREGVLAELQFVTSTTNADTTDQTADEDDNACVDLIYINYFYLASHVEHLARTLSDREQKCYSTFENQLLHAVLVFCNPLPTATVLMTVIGSVYEPRSNSHATPMLENIKHFVEQVRQYYNTLNQQDADLQLALLPTLLRMWNVPKTTVRALFPECFRTKYTFSQPVSNDTIENKRKQLLLTHHYLTMPFTEMRTNPVTAQQMLLDVQCTDKYVQHFAQLELTPLFAPAVCACLKGSAEIVIKAALKLSRAKRNKTQN